MRIGIDASNIRAGGGLIHLSKVLEKVQLHEHSVDSVVVWSGKTTLKRLPTVPWLEKVEDPLLNGGLIKRVYWQQYKMYQELQEKCCDLLFLPGTTSPHNFEPSVTILQNVLPFEVSERRRYGVSAMYARLTLLQSIQRRNMKAVQGIIFMTNSSRKTVVNSDRKLEAIPWALIPHGVDKRFFCAPRHSEPIGAYSDDNPFMILYVSDVTMYKHQWHLIEAIGKLRQKGYPVQLSLVGGLSKHRTSIRRLKTALETYDPTGDFVAIKGRLSFEKLHKEYHRAHMFAFPSTCESQSIVLLEAMASGLPIASSNRELMQEVLGQGAVYFDAEDVADITLQLEKAILSPELRTQVAKEQFIRAQGYSWERCARETFSFLTDIYRGAKRYDD